MNCRTCQYDLSQSLDGRLPSGRRRVVMDHVASCDACSQFWAEMQRLQRCVLQLPSQQTSADFRDRLFERIESGEGTPPAVFHEPIPLMKKVRYIGTGAAAAAALLAVATLSRAWKPAGAPATALVADASGSPEAPSHPASPASLHDSRPRTGAQSDRSLAATADNASNPAGGQSAGGLVLRTSEQRTPMRVASDPAIITGITPSGGQHYQLALDPMQDNWISTARPLTANLVGVEAAKVLSRSVASTNDSLKSLDQFAAASDATSAFWARTVCANAVEIKELGELLIELGVDDQIFIADTEMDIKLRVLVERLRSDIDSLRGGSMDTVRRIVAPVMRDSATLVQLPRKIRVSPAELHEHQPITTIFKLSQTRPQVFERLFVVLPSGSRDLMSIELQNPGDAFQPDACSPIVAPRSEIEAMDRIRRLLEARFK